MTTYRMPNGSCDNSYASLAHCAKLWAKHVLRHLILTTALQGECDYRLHFADQEAEAQKD